MAEVDIAALVALHHESVYRYAYRLTGSAVDAEDFVQETFLIAQQKLDQLRDGEAARGWLYAILRNCFIRSQRYSHPIPAGSIDLNIDHLPDESSQNEEIDGERLQKALDRIAPKHRLMLSMFYFEDISYREIARQLDLPIGTVMSRLARAKSRLRTELFKSDKERADCRPTVAKQL